MNVGLRPRLKARPSLYDLVRNRNIDLLSIQPLPSSFQELPAELPPLPLSPSKNYSTPPTPDLPNHPEPAEDPAKMAPKKEVAKDADGEDQYGMSQYQQERRIKLMIAMQARFTRFLGMQISSACLFPHTDLVQARRGGREHDWCCYVRIGMDHLPNQYLKAHALQVRVGHDNLVGEVIRIEADRATIQVYEETGMEQDGTFGREC